MLPFFVAATFICTVVAGRHIPPTPRAVARVPRALQYGDFSSVTISSASSLWPLAANVSQPVNPVPCSWSAAIADSYIPGCADGGYPCAPYPTLAQAQAACALDYQCGGVTSQDGGGPPWETRHGTRAIFSGQGESSYLIDNDCHEAGAICHALPPTFSISASGASNQILVDAMARYTQIVNTAYAPTTTLPPNATLISSLSVTITSADDTLRFGVDESYTLNISSAGAQLSAATVWGALRGLETFSQITHHTWTTNSEGSLNASFNQVCETAISDAPRFPMRSLMLDTARHFLPISVIKQVIDLASYLKLNSVRLHLIDTDSWSYFIPTLPNVTNQSAYSPLHVYYPDDLAELVAFGRARGVIVWPEVDFPSHSASILQSIPELGCLDPSGKYRMYIDPTFPDLWPTIDQVFSALNVIFPPEYPFHMGGDEVDRNSWATCPSVVSWAATQGCASNDVANCVTDWWYTALYNRLHAPPFNRVVFAWEDVTDAVNASWVGASDGGAVIEQWNGDPGVWNSDVCEILKANVSVLVSGPFHDVIGTAPSFNSNPEENYYDILNVTCAPLTPRQLQQIVGPELMFWDDAADISASDIILMLMSSVVPVAETGWSRREVVATGVVNPTRYEDLRCRLARRGLHSHDAFGHVGTFCAIEYDEILMPWSA